MRYRAFEAMRDRLISDEKLKRQVAVDGYSKKLAIGRFWFANAKVVPDDLKEFIVKDVNFEKERKKRSKKSKKDPAK